MGAPCTAAAAAAAAGCTRLHDSPPPPPSTPQLFDFMKPKVKRAAVVKRETVIPKPSYAIPTVLLGGWVGGAGVVGGCCTQRRTHAWCWWWRRGRCTQKQHPTNAIANSLPCAPAPAAHRALATPPPWLTPSPPPPHNPQAWRALPTWARSTPWITWLGCWAPFWPSKPRASSLCLTTRGWRWVLPQAPTPRPPPPPNTAHATPHPTHPRPPTQVVVGNKQAKTENAFVGGENRCAPPPARALA